MLCAPEDEDYSSDEDEDYLPSGEASEGDSEDDDDVEEDEQEGREVKGQRKAKVKKRNKKKKPSSLETKRSRTGGLLLPDDERTEEQKEEMTAEEPASVFKEEDLRATEMKKQEKEKQKSDDLWSSFLKDVGQKPKAKMPPSCGSSSGSLGASSEQATSGTNGKEIKAEKVTNSTSKKTVTVTEVFEFAGEEVKVTKEVSADSEEAKKLLQPSEPAEETGPTASLASKSAPPIGSKRPGGGLSSVLGLINKKPKMTVLEKSRLDWTNFTTTEGIADDLKLHNKGKAGYIEKQKFLEQADQRQYEKERDLRLGVAKR